MKGLYCFSEKVLSKKQYARRKEAKETKEAKEATAKTSASAQFLEELQKKLEHSKTIRTQMQDNKQPITDTQ